MKPINAGLQTSHSTRRELQRLAPLKCPHVEGLIAVICPRAINATEAVPLPSMRILRTASYVLSASSPGQIVELGCLVEIQVLSLSTFLDTCIYSPLQVAFSRMLKICAREGVPRCSRRLCTTPLSLQLIFRTAKWLFTLGRADAIICTLQFVEGGCSV